MPHSLEHHTSAPENGEGPWPSALEAPGRRTSATRPVRATLLAGVALILLAGAITLTRSSPRVVHVNTTAAKTYLTGFVGDATICQGNEVLPAGVTAIRLWLGVEYGSRIRVTMSAGGRLLTDGRRGPDWTSRSVTVPVKPLSRQVSHAKLCMYLGPGSEPVYPIGAEVPPAEMAVARLGRSHVGKLLGGRVGAEYLTSGRGSWWTRILAVARHMGLGHALTGTWVALLVAALFVVMAMLSARLVLRELPAAGPEAEPRPRGGRTRPARWPMRPFLGLAAALRRVPTAAWMCALVAFLNASAWSLIVPPFQGRDEEAHFAYVEQLAEDRVLPEGGRENGTYSPKEMLVLEGLHFWDTVRWPQTPAISSEAEQRALMSDVHADASLRGSGEAGAASSEPPLYYALETIPYALGSGNMLTQLQLMRLLGALFGAATALLTFLFLREILPRARCPATVGALCVALQPLFAFVSGSVNPDTMLFAVCAAVFLCMARAFRRGLTRRGAVTLGLVIAVGFVTKFDFIGFAAGVLVGLAVLAIREARSRGVGAVLPAALAAGVGLLPVVLEGLRNVVSSHEALGTVSGNTSLLAPKALVHELSYIWQVYLPRLPGMPHYFIGLATYKDIWFDRFVGLYGWIDTTFPGWVDDLALVPATALALLCARELIARRDALRSRLPELGCYAAITLAVLMLVGITSYQGDVIQHQHAFGEPRYLLPLIPLLGALVALAVRGAGRRWMPVAGAAVGVLFLGHDLFSQLQVIARYYG